MALEQKFVPAANWASTPFLGPQIVLIDENNNTGLWNGTGYSSSGIRKLSAAQLAQPTAALLADTRAIYELEGFKILYRSNGVNLEPVGGATSAFGVPYQVAADGVVLATSCIYYGVRCKAAGTIALYDNVAASGDTLLGATAMTTEQIISWGGAGRLCFVGVYADWTSGSFEVLLNPIA